MLPYFHIEMMTNKTESDCFVNTAGEIFRVLLSVHPESSDCTTWICSFVRVEREGG
jgi:hypothetical protein